MKKEDNLSEQELEQEFGKKVTEALDNLSALKDDSSDGGKVEELVLDMSDLSENNESLEMK